MPNADEIAGRLYRQAEELRSIAANMRDPDSRNAMVKAVEDYERLAKQAIEASPRGAVE